MEQSLQPVALFRFTAMATVFTLHLQNAAPTEARICFEQVRDEVERVEQTFSRFRPSSELGRINRNAADHPVVTDPEVFQLLAVAFELARRTDGRFDPTIGPLTQLWRSFVAAAQVEPQAQTPPPTPLDWMEALQAVQQRVGFALVELDPEQRAVHFTRPGMELDLGALAKGYAVDRALELLISNQIEGVIDAGSSSIAATPGALLSLTTIALGHPLHKDRTVGHLSLNGRALATSGVREQSFLLAGERFSHLLDPTQPTSAQHTQAQPVLQTTVLAPSATVADALSTALFLLGPAQSASLLHRFPDCSALWWLQASGQIVCQACNWPGELPNQI